MLRVLIVDDEPWVRAELRLLLQEHDDVAVAGEAESVESAVRRLEDDPPDVLFLDVHLRGRSGFEVFELVPVRCHVVFVTAHDEYAVRAFEVDALDYLVKPVLPDQLERALDRVRDRPVIATDGRLAVQDRVYLKDSSRIRGCRVGQITHIQASDVYCEVHIAGGDAVLVRDRLANWEERLPDSFVRIHRSTLINRDFVERLELRGGRHEVKLEGVAEPLSVSRRLASAVKEKLESGP